MLNNVYSDTNKEYKHMLPKERQEIILKKIDEEGIVYLSELTKELQASTCTIRRDFDKLESDHLVKRVHGGAVKYRIPSTS